MSAVDHLVIDYEIYEQNKMLWDMHIANAEDNDVFVSIFIVNQGEEHKKKALRNMRDGGDLVADVLFIDSRDYLAQAIEEAGNIIDEHTVLISRANETMRSTE